MGRKKRVTLRQKRYVEEYFIDYNQKAAAIRAGYSPHSASDIAYELMQNPDIQEMIQLRESQLSARIGISQERIKRELAALAFGNMRNFVNIEDGEVSFKNMEDISEFDSAAIQEVTVTKTKDGSITRFKIAEKKGPLELLGKIEKMFTEQLEVKDVTDRADNMKRARERAKDARD